MWLTGIIGLLAVVHFGLELAVTGLTYVEENSKPCYMTRIFYKHTLLQV
jgi:hypothetical protein